MEDFFDTLHLVFKLSHHTFHVVFRGSIADHSIREVLTAIEGRLDLHFKDSVSLLLKVCFSFFLCSLHTVDEVSLFYSKLIAHFFLFFVILFDATNTALLSSFSLSCFLMVIFIFVRDTV
jgi:hypothetical protein